MAAERWKRSRACSGGSFVPGSSASSASFQIRATDRVGVAMLVQLDRRYVVAGPDTGGGVVGGFPTPMRSALTFASLVWEPPGNRTTRELTRVALPSPKWRRGSSEDR